MSISLEHLFDGSPAARNFETLARAVNPPLPQARVYNSANISVVSATVAALTFDSERFDNGSLHSTSASTSRLTAPLTGLYAIGGAVSFSPNATGYRQLFVRLNGATMVDDHIIPTYGGGVATRLTVSTIYQLAAGDYVELAVSHNAGAALNIEAIGNSSPEFWMVRLGGYANQGI